MSGGRIRRQGRFLRRFRRATRAVVTVGNRLRILPEGGELFRRILEAIDAAASLICLEFYIIRDDRTGRVIADRLVAAAARGVSVYLVYDYIGCFDTPSSYFRRLQQAGVRLLPFNPLSLRRGVGWLDRRDHRKLLIVDGVRGFTGGFNIGDEYSGWGDSPPWRDVGIEMEGGAVSVLLSLFCQIWYQESGERLPFADRPFVTLHPPGDEEVYVVSGGPHHTRSFIRSAFRMAIAGASERVVIATPYFIPGPRLIRSLIRAARRGVEVTLILPAVSDVPLVSLVSRGSYLPLLTEGIRIVEREGEILHTKIMQIDGSWTVVGSANLDQRSFHRNFELGCIVTGPRFGGEVERLLRYELDRSRTVTRHHLAKRGILVRMVERILSLAASFL
ncbi:MAG: phospholipase D-like domain-containing protein [Desulfuromonadia bacterium]